MTNAVGEHRERVKLAAARMRYDLGLFKAVSMCMRKADKTSGETQLFAREVLACLRDWTSDEAENPNSLTCLPPHNRPIKAIEVKDIG